MAAQMTVATSPLWTRMRWVVWGGAAALLMLPAIAMQFDTEFDWSLFDFVAMGVMLVLVCGAFELAVRMARSHAYVVAAGVAVVNAFLMTWINLAVGIIGNESNPANQMFFGVLAISFIGVVMTRLDALNLARAMEVTAVAQAIVSIITVVIGEGYIFVLTGFFVAMWLMSAQLFRKAARDDARVGEENQIALRSQA